jgi:hypothetical protein
MGCNYRGVCNLGYCECMFPFYGRACEKGWSSQIFPLLCCPSNSMNFFCFYNFPITELCGHNQTCFGHGSCTNNTVSRKPTHVCLCDDGWTGEYCSEIGSLSHKPKDILCCRFQRPLHSGDSRFHICRHCKWNLFYYTLTWFFFRIIFCVVRADDDCPYNCLNHGVCEGGACLCNKGWTGDYCQDSECANFAVLCPFFFNSVFFLIVWTGNKRITFYNKCQNV